MNSIFVKPRKNQPVFRFAGILGSFLVLTLAFSASGALLTAEDVYWSQYGGQQRVLGVSLAAPRSLLSGSGTFRSFTVTQVGPASYQVDWSRVKNARGSLYITLKSNRNAAKILSIPNAGRQGSETFAVTPGTAYRVEFYSKPNSGGNLLLRKYFTALKRPDGSTPTPTPTSTPAEVSPSPPPQAPKITFTVDAFSGKGQSEVLAENGGVLNFVWSAENVNSLKADSSFTEDLSLYPGKSLRQPSCGPHSTGLPSPFYNNSEFSKPGQPIALAGEQARYVAESSSNCLSGYVFRTVLTGTQQATGRTAQAAVTVRVSAKSPDANRSWLKLADIYSLEVGNTREFGGYDPATFSPADGYYMIAPGGRLDFYAREYVINASASFGSLSLENPPPGITASFGASSAAGEGRKKTLMTISVANTVAPGFYILRVKASNPSLKVGAYDAAALNLTAHGDVPIMVKP